MRRPSPAVALTAVAAAALVIGSRFAFPFAPALYDGIAPVSPEPYRYVSPPPDLAPGNKPPLAIDGPIQFSNGTNLAHAVTTPDQQLLVSINDGAVKIPGVSTLHVHVGPVTQPPAAPQGSTFVGNVYEAVFTDYTPPGGGAPSSAGFPLPPQPNITGSVQALMRVPPVAYNNVRLYYAGSWHDITGNWGAQGDYVAISPMTHFGLVAAFNDTTKPKPKPQAGGTTFPVVALTIGVAVVALGLIAAGVVVQLRRAPATRRQ